MESLFKIAEELLVNFSVRRVFTAVVVVAFGLAGVAGYEAYTAHFRLTRLEQGLRVLNALDSAGSRPRADTSSSSQLRRHIARELARTLASDVGFGTPSAIGRVLGPSGRTGYAVYVPINWRFFAGAWLWIALSALMLVRALRTGGDYAILRLAVVFFGVAAIAGWLATVAPLPTSVWAAVALLAAGYQGGALVLMVLLALAARALLAVRRRRSA